MTSDEVHAALGGQDPILGDAGNTLLCFRNFFIRHIPKAILRFGWWHSRDDRLTVDWPEHLIENGP